MLEAIDSLVRGGVLVDIGGMMERPGLDLFAMMCSQRSVLGSLWFSTREAQDMADMTDSGALDLSVLEHHTFPLAQVNEALDTIPKRHGGVHKLPLHAVRFELLQAAPAGHRQSAPPRPHAAPEPPHSYVARDAAATELPTSCSRFGISIAT
jgi:hypothetical protein